MTRRSKGRRGFREGREVTLYPDKQSKRKRAKAKARVSEQQKRAAIRAKYGPSGKPAPVRVYRIGDEA